MRHMLSLMLLLLGAAGSIEAQQLGSTQLERGPRFLLASGTQMVPVDVNRTPALARRLDLDLRGVTLREALAQISARAGLRLVYTEDVIPVSQPVSLRADGISVVGALTDLLFNAGVDVVFDERGDAALVRRPRVQAGAIVGQVTDVKTGQVVADADVSLDGTSHRTVSDRAGQFRLAAVPVGTYTLRVRYIGYTPATQAVTVTDGQETTANVALERSIQKLDEMVTTGTLVSTEVKALPTPITIITAEDIERQNIQRFDQLFGGQVPGIIARDPGPTTFQNSFTVRGASAILNSASVKTYIDGVEVANANFISQIDPNSIERIEITRGPQGATLYGAEALSGVMQIFTKKGSATARRPELSGKVSVGGVSGDLGENTAPATNNSLSISGGSENATYNVTGFYRQTGAWLPEFKDRNWGFSAGTRFAHGPFTLSASARAAVTSRVDPWNTLLQQYPAYSTPPEWEFRFREQGYSLTAGYQALPNWHHTLTVGYAQNDGTSGVVRPRRTTPADTLLSYQLTSMNQLTLFYHTDVSVRLSPAMGANITAGFNYSEHALEMGYAPNLPARSGIFMEPGSYLGSFPNANLGYFSQAQLSVADRFFLTAGVRAEQNDRFGESIDLAWSPRVGASYAIPVGPAQMKLRVAYGQAIRPPAFGAAEGEIRASSITKPNPTLRPERQRGWDGGVELYVGQRASLGVTYYNQKTEDLVDRTVLPPENGLPTFQNINAGGIRNEGWEFEATLGVGPVDVRGAYSIMRSRVETLASDYFGDYQIEDRLIGNPESTAGVTLAYTPWSGTTVSGSLTHFGGFVNYDMAALFGFYDGGDPFRGSMRDYWMEYPSVTRIGASIRQQLSQAVTGFVQVDNLGNNHRSQMSNLDRPTPRTVMVGATFRY